MTFLRLAIVATALLLNLPCVGVAEPTSKETAEWLKKKMVGPDYENKHLWDGGRLTHIIRRITSLSITGSELVLEVQLTIQEDKGPIHYLSKYRVPLHLCSPTVVQEAGPKGKIKKKGESTVDYLVQTTWITLKAEGGKSVITVAETVDGKIYIRRADSVKCGIGDDVELAKRVKKALEHLIKLNANNEEKEPF